MNRTGKFLPAVAQHGNWSRQRPFCLSWERGSTGVTERRDVLTGRRLLRPIKRWEGRKSRKSGAEPGIPETLGSLWSSNSLFHWYLKQYFTQSVCCLFKCKLIVKAGIRQEVIMVQLHKSMRRSSIHFYTNCNPNVVSPTGCGIQFWRSSLALRPCHLLRILVYHI